MTGSDHWSAELDVLAAGKPIVYDEWRVVADHRDGLVRQASPGYDFTWSKRLNPHLCDPDAESAARAHVALSGFQQSCENIRILHRTVTVNPWAEEMRPAEGPP